MRLMLIAPRFAYNLDDFLQRKFAGDGGVLVVRGRRAGQRRTRPAMRHVDRRRGDRRGRERGAVGIPAPRQERLVISASNPGQGTGGAVAPNGARPIQPQGSVVTVPASARQSDTWRSLPRGLLA